MEANTPKLDPAIRFVVLRYKRKKTYHLVCLMSKSQALEVSKEQSTKKEMIKVKGFIPNFKDDAQRIKFESLATLFNCVKCKVIDFSQKGCSKCNSKLCDGCYISLESDKSGCPSCKKTDIDHVYIVNHQFEAIIK